MITPSIPWNHYNHSIFVLFERFHRPKYSQSSRQSTFAPISSTSRRRFNSFIWSSSSRGVVIVVVMGRSGERQLKESKRLMVDCRQHREGPRTRRRRRGGLAEAANSKGIRYSNWKRMGWKRRMEEMKCWRGWCIGGRDSRARFQKRVFYYGLEHCQVIPITNR